MTKRWCGVCTECTHDEQTHVKGMPNFHIRRCEATVMSELYYILLVKINQVYTSKGSLFTTSLTTVESPLFKACVITNHIIYPLSALVDALSSTKRPIRGCEVSDDSLTIHNERSHDAHEAVKTEQTLMWWLCTLQQNHWITTSQHSNTPDSDNDF